MENQPGEPLSDSSFSDDEVVSTPVPIMGPVIKRECQTQTRKVVIMAPHIAKKIFPASVKSSDQMAWEYNSFTNRRELVLRKTNISELSQSEL